VIELRQQVEEGRKAEENIRKQYLEKEEQHQVEVNSLKSKLEERINCYDFNIVLIFWMTFLVVKDPLLSKLVLAFMNLLKVNLAHKVRQGTLMRILK